MAVLNALSTTTPPGPWICDRNTAGTGRARHAALAKDPADRPDSAEVVVKELRTIERELLANRQKAELAAATLPTAVVRPSNEAPGEIRRGNEPGTTGVDASNSPA